MIIKSLLLYLTHVPLSLSLPIQSRFSGSTISTPRANEFPSASKVVGNSSSHGHAPRLASKREVKEKDLIASDENERRYFPELPILPEDIFDHVPIPNCTAPFHEKRVGCLGTVGTFVTEPPGWAGKIRFENPVCTRGTNGDRRNEKCELRIPMTRKFHSAPLHASRDEQLELADLPGDEEKSVATAIADFDGDGLTDLFIGYHLGGRVLLNEGDGSFSEYSISILNTTSVAVADIDNDGSVDVLIGTERYYKNWLFLNEGDGRLSEPIPLPGGELETTSIAVADFDDDGMLDIVIGNDEDENQLLVNRGNGSFSDHKNLPGGGMYTQCIAVADVDHDGSVDILVGNGYEQHNQLLLNRGDGTFYDNVTLLPGEKMDTTSIAIADVNGDKSIDVIIGNWGVQNQLLLNPGEGNFKEAIELPGGEMSTNSIALADIDGDGSVDIIVGNEEEFNQLLLNNGNGSFDDNDIILPGGEFKTASIAVADIDGDSSADIIFGNKDGYDQIVTHRKHHSFDAIKLPGQPISTHSIAIADIDNDGFVDIITANKGRKYEMLFNHRDGSFEDPVELMPGEALGEPTSVVAADFNYDGFIDVVIGNLGSKNHLLLNRGDGSFEDPIDLPGIANTTFAIAVADLDNDGLPDIIVGNALEINELLLNAGNGKFDPIKLPGGELATHSTAVGDMNGDGMIDILIGNQAQTNQLLINRGGREFDLFNLTGEEGETESIAVADVDADGQLDILVGNYGQKSHLIMNRGNGTFHDPIHLPGEELYTWMIVAADINGDEFVDIIISTHNGYNKLFLNEGNGTFHDATNLPGGVASTYSVAVADVDKDGFVDVLLGNRAGSNLLIHYTSCPTGGVKLHSSSWCFNCPSGFFQKRRGQAKCDACSRGGYCNDIFGGGYRECPQGTFNNKTGMSDIFACIKCPIGTYSTETGARSMDSCQQCPEGTFHDKTGMSDGSACVGCPVGTFLNLENKTECRTCDAGTYADKTGLTECLPCPNRLDSVNGSDTCPFCASGFYLKNSSSDESDVYRNPSDYCLECPELLEATCPDKNTTLETLRVPSGFWRASLETAQMYKCDSNTCIGSKVAHRDQAFKTVELSKMERYAGRYCSEGHEGPLCEVCTDDRGFYFSRIRGHCTNCPSGSRLSILAILMSILCLAYITLKTFVHAPWLGIISSIGLQAKVKILVSFYQVITALEVVYGVKISRELSTWLNLFQYFNLNIFDLLGMPKSCMGSIKQQLILSAVWPYILVFVVGGYVFFRTILKIKRSQSTSDFHNKTLRPLILDGVYRWIKALIVILYFTIPIVSRDIFDAIKCRSLRIKDHGDPPFFKSYLLVDMSIECSAENDDKYRSIQGVFWTFFVLCPVLTPLCFLVLLIYINDPVKTKSITPLANACRFLWIDYDESVWFWDVIDLWRKIFLTGFIMFIDTQEGSAKILRLVIATIISIIFLSILAISRPYKRPVDLYLAFMSNLLLATSFSAGTILKLCDRDMDESGICNRFVGLSLDSFGASVLVVSSAVGMLIIVAGTLGILAINRVLAPTVLLAYGKSPNLELSDACSFHAFMSHVWSTGQAKTHAITSKLQLYMPKLKIWLDVNNLDDIGKLEECVASAEVFILFYSAGYFQSKNCRREVYTAVRLDKPIIVLYEGNNSIIETLRTECSNHCVDPESPGVPTILEHLFGDVNSFSDDHVPPILWLDVKVFSAAALNMIYHRLLSYLPHYQKNPLELSKGVVVPGEFHPVPLKHSVNVLVWEKNEGAGALVSEIKSTLSDKESSLISITDAETYFNQQNEEVDRGASKSICQSHDATVLLLYLNSNFVEEGLMNRAKLNIHFFEEHVDSLRKVVESSINDTNIKVVLVHEQDFAKGGCPFNVILEQAPQELIDPPYELFKDIAIPLYSLKEYRIVSFHQILSHFIGSMQESNCKKQNKSSFCRNCLIVPLLEGSNSLKSLLSTSSSEEE